MRWCWHLVFLKPYSTQFSPLLKWLVSDDIINLLSNYEQFVRVIRLDDPMYDPMRAEWSDRQDVLIAHLWVQENNYQMLTTTQFRNVMCMIFSLCSFSVLHWTYRRSDRSSCRLFFPQFSWFEDLYMGIDLKKRISWIACSVCVTTLWTQRNQNMYKRKSASTEHEVAEVNQAFLSWQRNSEQ